MADWLGLTTTTFGREYFEQHLREGLDYSNYGDWQRKYGRWLVDVLNWHGQPVLDVGCCCGNMVAGLAESGAISAGIDPNEFAIQLGRQKWSSGEWTNGLTGGAALPFSDNPPLSIGDAVNLHQFADEHFSGLHSHQTAEHWKPELVPHILREIGRVSKPGALFFCTLDTQELADRTGRDLQREDPTHVCIRPMKWWREQLADAGWEICTEEFRTPLLAHGWSFLRDYDWDWWIARKVPTYDVTSKFCVRADFDQTWHAAWIERLGLTGQLRRKEWEHTHIARALEERGLLSAGQRGLGFGVGSEPLTAAFAATGCSILATDVPSEAWKTCDWANSLNARGHCPAAEFEQRVTTRELDMNAIHQDLTGFDFAWSACSLDHLGTLWHSERFILNAMNCVRPGGWCVHTAEYSLDPRAQGEGATVYFTYASLRSLIETIQRLGHRIARIDWNLGDRWEDHHTDTPPWPGPHLKLIGDGVVATSVLLIIQRGYDRPLWFPEDPADSQELRSELSASPF